MTVKFTLILLILTLTLTGYGGQQKEQKENPIPLPDPVTIEKILDRCAKEQGDLSAKLLKAGVELDAERDYRNKLIGKIRELEAQLAKHGSSK